MRKKISILLVYLLGLIQGVAFTTIPAAANFLTNSKGFNFTESEYGSIFLPMILGAIIASFAGGMLAKRYSVKNVLLVGIFLSAASMALFALSLGSYSLMLITMLLLGTGFGANITSLNPFAIHFFPNKASAAITALHSCLGIGTAIGPLMWILFRNFHHWWGDPVILAAAFAALFFLGFIFLPRSAKLEESSSPSTPHYWLLVSFALIALIYGIIETTYGNWSTIYFHQTKKMSSADANTLLSIFWGSVTGGRIIATFLSMAFPPKWIYRVLPFLILISAITLHLVVGFDGAAAVMFVGGLGCSAFLPLSVSFGVQNLKNNPTFASGLVIGTYMIGYGIAAEGIGFLHKTEDVSFDALFLTVAALAVLLIALNFGSTWKMKESR